MNEVPEERSERLILSPNRKTVTREERVALGFVATCGGIGLVLGGLYIWSNMAKPFLITYTGERYMDSDDAKNAERTKQRKSDTDKDGISDYDELYIFKTSPYLDDSDSDGLKDGAEVQSGGDPNCALGTSCAQADKVTGADAVNPETVNGAAFLEQNGLTVGADGLLTGGDTATALDALPVAEIRKFLVTSGLSKEDVDKIPDNVILEIYNQALAEAQNAQLQEEVAAAAEAQAGASTAPAQPDSATQTQP